MMSSIRDSKRRAAAPREERRLEPGAPRAGRVASRSDGQSGGGELILTTANKILVAALVLDEERESFTAEDLIVRSWVLYPESFGLSGYRELYPDSNRVLSKLMGSVGLCSRGWLEQVSTKTYRMTVAGRKLAQTLRTGQSPSEAVEVTPVPTVASVAPVAPVAPVASVPARPARVEKREVRAVSAPEPERTREVAKIVPRERTPRESVVEPLERAEAKSAPSPAPRAESPKPVAVVKPAPVAAAPKIEPKPEPKPAPAPAPATKSGEVVTKFEATAALQRLVASAAGQKFTRGGLVTWADACQFWAITSAIHPVHLATRLEEIEALLKRAEQAIQSTAAPIKIHDRLEVSLTTVIGLQGLHRMLTQKYHRELDAIRARGEE